MTGQGGYQNMKNRFVAAFALLITFFAFFQPVQAQEANAWIQVEANPTLRAAEDGIRVRSARMANVAGFRLPGGWYAVALGPYTEEQAGEQLRALKAAGAIPGDSFIMFTNQYRQQFWPVGAAATAPVVSAQPTPEPSANTDEPEANGITGAATPEVTEPQAPVVPEPLPEETKREARASERLLTSDERKALQIAMQWQGFYTSLIDGDFGPGTRKAMADWQQARGFDVTGILTTRQRAQLLAEYQAELDKLGLRVARDEGAGIEMALPLAMVAFDRYEAPFAHYKSINDSGVRVILISQSGDQNTLFGLYDIMQSLEIVPLNGERSRKASEFTITGTDDSMTSYTYAKLVDGAVKGFTLIWPLGQDERLRELALGQMQTSFASIPGMVLADNAGLDQATQSIDLMSGLEIRRPTISRSGFYVGNGGAVLTTAEAVASCGRVTIDEIYDASVAATDPVSGLAVLQPRQRLAPVGVARLLNGDPRLGAGIAVAGYPFEGALSAPTLTFGTLADVRGLHGEEGIDRLELVAQPGDAGGPVLGPSGAVIGMLLPRPDGDGQRLPEAVNFAAKSDVLAAFLGGNGVAAQISEGGAAVDPVDLSAMAADMTVLVSCWN